MSSRGGREIILLRAQKRETSIKCSDQLVLIGSDYQTESEASTAGSMLQNALMVALAKVRVGADFGYRASKGMFTADGLQWAEQSLGQKVLNNTHGLMIFRSNPQPFFVSMNVEAIRGASPEIFLSCFAEAISLQPRISERDLLAYTLFNASFFQPTEDSRFLMLVMSIEALIEPAYKSSYSQNHVGSLIDQTKSSSLPIEERNSILGSLNRLRRESISQAGKRLVRERLGVRVYGDRTATKFFEHCYTMRSNLVHGNLSVPTYEEVGRVAATLELFVSDLLTCPILG